MFFCNEFYYGKLCDAQIFATLNVIMVIGTILYPI